MEKLRIAIIKRLERATYEELRIIYIFIRRIIR